MGEKNCKWNSWQRISLQNTKVALAAHYKKKQTPNKKKWTKYLNTFLQRRHIDGKQIHEKMLNIAHY